MGITVGSSAEKLKRQTTRLLEHGEFLVASGRFVRCVGAEQSRTLNGAAVPDKLALAVTDRRVLVLRLGGPLERVSEVTHSIPLRAIVDVRSVRGAKIVHLDIAFADGSAVSLEADRPNAKAGEEVARALTTALARR